MRGGVYIYPTVIKFTLLKTNEAANNIALERCLQTAAKVEDSFATSLLEIKQHHAYTYAVLAEVVIQ